MTTSRPFVAITCAFAAVLAWPSGSWAEEVTIYACAQKNSGELRIVDGPDDCRKSEVSVSWNQEGPPGPPGPPGESANLDVHRLADLLGDPSLADGLPLGVTHPVECEASLVFEGPDGSTAAVIGLIGTEAVSQTFAFHVLVDDIAAASNAWLGQPGQVTFARDEGTTIFGGIITEVGTSGDDGGTGYTVIALEPQLAVLARNADYRVFQDNSVPEIIAEILGESDLDFFFQLTGSYDRWPCTVQYNESDLNLVARLAEAAGIFFYFDEDGTAVFGDSAGGFGGGLSLAYPGAALPLPVGEEAITGLKRGGGLTPDQATVRGYSLNNPIFPPEATVGTGDGSREVYSYDASLTDGGMVTDRATVNLERFQVPLDRTWGTSTSADVRAGYGLAVSDASGNGLSGDSNVTEVTHVFVRTGDGCLAYGNVFEAVPSGTDYRPPRLTPVPKVQGLHSAIVTSGAGAGRVIVQFIWDRLGEFDEQSFCPVRVNQPAGTLGAGEPFIPSAGEEVLVGFIQGDPSQPVVLGSLFNGANPPPAP